VGIAVWGKGWERGLLIASTLVAAIAQGLMSVDIISSVKVQRRLGLRQLFFVAVLAAVAIFFPFTEWWRLYVVTLGGAFAIILIYLVG